MADTEEMCEARIRHRTRVASHPRGDSREEAMSESEDELHDKGAALAHAAVGRGAIAKHESVPFIMGYVARAAEESAAKAERSKRAAELIANVREHIYGDRSITARDALGALNELRELLGVGDES